MKVYQGEYTKCCTSEGGVFSEKINVKYAYMRQGKSWRMMVFDITSKQWVLYLKPLKNKEEVIAYAIHYIETGQFP